MNKAEWMDAIASRVSGLSKKAVGEVLEAFTATVGETLKKRDPVALLGFGTFKVKKRAARTGRNPRTGEAITIAAAHVPTFAPGKALKEAVNLSQDKGKRQ